MAVYILWALDGIKNGPFVKARTSCGTKLFISQGLDGIKIRGFPGGINAEEYSNGR